MWVFVGMIPLSLLYLVRPFGNGGCWHKSLTPSYYVLQIIHCNICKFSMSIGMSSLTKKKKTLANQTSTCDSQTWAWTCIIASCITSTLVKFVAIAKWVPIKNKMSCNSLHMHNLNIWNFIMHKKNWRLLRTRRLKSLKIAIERLRLSKPKKSKLLKVVA
jgi:hypothetical protein